MSRNRLTAILIVVAILITMLPATVLAAPGTPPAPTGSFVDLVTIESPNDSGLSADWRIAESEDGSLQVSPDMTLQLIFAVADDGTVTADGVGGSAIDAMYAMMGYTSTFGDYTKFPKYWDDALDNSGVESLQIYVRGNKVAITVDGEIVVADARLSGIGYVWSRVEAAGFAWAGTADMFAAALALSQELGLNSVNFAILTSKFDGSPLAWPETYGATQAAASAPAATKNFSVTVLAGEGTPQVLARLVRDSVDRGCAAEAIKAYRAKNAAWDPGTEVPIPATCVPVALGGTLAPAAVPTQLGQ